MSCSVSVVKCPSLSNKLRVRRLFVLLGMNSLFFLYIVVIIFFLVFRTSLSEIRFFRFPFFLSYQFLCVLIFRCIPLEFTFVSPSLSINSETSAVIHSFLITFSFPFLFSFSLFHSTKSSSVVLLNSVRFSLIVF